MIASKQRDDDIVGRRNRGEPGEHDEGGERREKGKRDRRKTQRPRDPAGRRCRACRDFGGGGLADVGHELASPKPEN
jgi:hypothetical protein